MSIIQDIRESSHSIKIALSKQEITTELAHDLWALMNKCELLARAAHNSLDIMYDCNQHINSEEGELYSDFYELTLASGWADKETLEEMEQDDSN